MKMTTEESSTSTAASFSTEFQSNSPTGANYGADLYAKGRKRMKTLSEGKNSSFSPAFVCDVSERKKPQSASKVMDYSDPFSVPDLLQGLDGGIFGSVTKEIEDLFARRMQVINTYYAMNPQLTKKSLNVEKSPAKEASKHSASPSACQDVIILEDDEVANNAPAVSSSVVVLDSDDEENCGQIPLYPSEEVALGKLDGEKDVVDCSQSKNSREDVVVKKDRVYVGLEDDVAIEEVSRQSDGDYDDLADIWKEMTLALECFKDTANSHLSDVHVKEGEEECDHSIILKDDLGYVCRICGVIQKGIETIIEYQYAKGTRSIRTYAYEARGIKDREPAEIFPDGAKLSAHDFSMNEISAHPRHRKLMKPHQVEGFNFLLSNLVTDNPGGCIMAHAPGSGKTFMIISFMQSFMTKYPHARPLVILPKGILPTWKKEFHRWQIEDIPLYDFYSVKADNRSQQLEVLRKWAGQKSILFLGYKQFSAIVSDHDTSKITTTCQEILLTLPSILILDEGHTPRNEDTDVLNCLKKVQTHRKVVLSGTLYQNHVKEIFNILDLVRPKFLNLDTSRAIRRRIQSRLPISCARLVKKGKENVLFELIEHTLQKDENFKRKVTVIQDLREMTGKVLHYYKGDFLDELPGLVDFTVFLKLSPRQEREVLELKKLGKKFKISSDGSAIYVHPQLKYLIKNSSTKDRIDEVKIDEMLEKLDVKEGVKAKFFYHLLRLCESVGEKLLVFSQYLLPLKVLERIAVKFRSWSPGKEIFMITGDSNSEIREQSMEQFNKSPDARVFFGSIKACGEGISLVGASRILILDVPLNPSVTRQAIGRAYRPGQEKKVYTYRLVAANSPEEEDHSTCFRKESIAKMWFEWNEYSGHQDFEIEHVDVKDCGDDFLENSLLGDDVKTLYRR